MQIKITAKGKVRLDKDEVSHGDVRHVRDDVGHELIKRGLAVQVRRTRELTLGNISAGAMK